MPILDIEIVGELEETPDLAQRLADAAGAALDSPPQGTWITLHLVAAEHYAENGGATEGPPVIVRLLQAEPLTGNALETQLRALTTSIAELLHRPVENVHIIVEPPAAGRVSFGGSLRK